MVPGPGSMNLQHISPDIFLSVVIPSVQDFLLMIGSGCPQPKKHLLGFLLEKKNKLNIFRKTSFIKLTAVLDKAECTHPLLKEL